MDHVFKQNAHQMGILGHLLHALHLHHRHHVLRHLLHLLAGLLFLVLRLLLLVVLLVLHSILQILVNALLHLLILFHVERLLHLLVLLQQLVEIFHHLVEFLFGLLGGFLVALLPCFILVFSVLLLQLLAKFVQFVGQVVEVFFHFKLLQK